MLHGGGTPYGPRGAHSLTFTFLKKLPHLFIVLFYALAALLVLSVPTYRPPWFVDKDSTGASGGTSRPNTSATVQLGFDAMFSDWTARSASPWGPILAPRTLWSIGMRGLHLAVER